MGFFDDITRGISLGNLGEIGVGDIFAPGLTMPYRAVTAVGQGLEDVRKSVGAQQYPINLDPQTLAQQQEFIRALQAQSQGLGPSLGQAVLRQGASEAQQKAAAMAASQRGISPALAQRQAMQAQAGIQQQAASEAAKIAAQEQFNKQQLLAQQLAQQQQQALESQRISAGLSAAEKQSERGLIGSLIGGGAAVLAGAAHGGMIRGYAQGGVIPQGMSPVAAHIIGEDGYATPEMQAAKGAMIPGIPVVKGDSKKNDKVPVMLSPGEIVIPRSVALAPNAPEKSKKFVEKTLQESPVAKYQYQDGGQIPDYLMPNQPMAQEQIAPSAILGIPQISELPPLTQEQRQQLAERDALEREKQRIELMSPYGFVLSDNQLMPTSPATRTQQVEQLARQRVESKRLPPQIGGLGDQQFMDVDQRQPELPAMRTQQAMPMGMGFMDAYEQQMAGMRAESSALGQMAQEKAKVLGDYTKAIAQREQQYQQSVKGLQDLIAQTNQELRDSKVDPRRYYGDMSTMGRIGKGIALVLGSVAGGLQGTGKNVALDIINENINRDIEAQRDAINSKKTLLSGYYAQLGNLKDAETMARATMQDQVLNEMKIKEMEATNPVQKARLQQSMAAIQQERNRNLAVLAAKQTIAQATSGQAQQDPGQVLELARRTDPKLAESLEKRLVPGIGFAQREVPTKVLDEVASRKEMDAKLRSLYDFAERYAGSIDPQVRSRGQAMAQDAFLAIKRAESLGTLDKGSVEFVEKLIDNPAGFTAQLFAQPKFKVLIESNNRTLNSVLKSYGVKTPKDVSSLEKKVGK